MDRTFLTAAAETHPFISSLDRQSSEQLLSRLTGDSANHATAQAVSSSSKLVLKRHEMAEIDALLRAKVAHFEERLVLWKEREDEMKRRRADFAARVAKYKAEESDYENKMARASKRFEDACRQKEAKVEEIREQRDLLEQLRWEKRAKEEERERIMCYQAFLNMVVEQAEGGLFHEIGDLIRRYETLQATSDQLQAKLEVDRKNIEDLRGQLHKYIHDKQTQMLIANKEIATKNKDLEQMRLEVDRESHSLQKTKESSNVTNSTLGQTRLALQNLFMRCRTRHTAATDADDMKSMVAAISSRLGDLLYVVHSWRQHQLHAHPSVR